MSTKIQHAIASEDYTLELVMENGNRLLCNMEPYLHTIQFCPLQDKSVWETMEVLDTCLRWQGRQIVELSVDRMLDLFKDEDSQKMAGIKEATTQGKWLLHIELINGNQMDMDVEELLEYPMFMPLLEKGLWNTLQAKKHSICWKNKDVCFELSVQMLLNYF